MSSYLSRVAEKYRNKPVLFDTNLLVVLMVGRQDFRLIGRAKGTKEYVQEDFFFLQRASEHFTQLITTPYILAEVSNLLARLDRTLVSQVFDHLREFLQLHQELYTTGAAMLESP